MENAGAGTEGACVRERIRGLMAAQPFAVLCTQGGGQPYGSVIAYAFDPDLRSFVFGTPVATRKYRLLGQCEHLVLQGTLLQRGEPVEQGGDHLWIQYNHHQLEARE